MKPLIYFMRPKGSCGLWWCTCPFTHTGRGSTARDAYANWVTVNKGDVHEMRASVALV